jgi:parvulin-like peptidyl-prolyl isomerase
LLAGACHGGAPAPLAQRSRLPQGVVAKVGSEEIALTTVARIAAAQGVTAALARDRAVSDALFATAARVKFEGTSVVPVAERGALARALLEGFKADAISRGPASDAEVAELTAHRWQELDRPESVRTTHAVVKIDSPASDAKARAIADHIRDAVRGISDSEAFMRVAKAVPHDGVEVRVEHLPAVTADGRTLDRDNPLTETGQRFDVDFARVVQTLGVGQISEPTKTIFGYHVILCEARLPEQRVPLEQRRVRLYDAVIKGRAEQAKQELLSRLSAATPAQLERAVDDLTARVRVEE